MIKQQIYTKEELTLCLGYVCKIKCANHGSYYEVDDWIFSDDVDGYDDGVNLQWIVVKIPEFDPVRNKRLVRLIL